MHALLRAATPFIMLFPFICIHSLLALPLLASGSYAPVFANTTQLLSGSASPLPTSPANITSVIDDFVENWKQNNPNLTSVELDTILASANSVKEALTNPQSKAERQTVPPPPRHVHNPRHRRQLGNTTLEAARALVRQAQKEASLRNRERFQNPRLNNYYSNLSPEAAIKARTAVQHSCPDRTSTLHSFWILHHHPDHIDSCGCHSRV